MAPTNLLPIIFSKFKRPQRPRRKWVGVRTGQLAHQLSSLRPPPTKHARRCSRLESQLAAVVSSVDGTKAGVVPPAGGRPTSNGHTNGRGQGHGQGPFQGDEQECSDPSSATSHEVVWEVVRARAELGRMKTDGMAALHAQEVSSAVQRIENERLQKRSEITLIRDEDLEKEREEKDEKTAALLAEKEAAAKVLAVRFSRSQQVFADQVRENRGLLNGAYGANEPNIKKIISTNPLSHAVSAAPARPCRAAPRNGGTRGRAGGGKGRRIAARMGRAPPGGSHFPCGTCGEA